MNLNLRHVVLLVAFVFLPATAISAQITDQQVVLEYSQYKAAGMTDQQILLQMSKKGVTPSQLSRIKDQYDKLHATPAVSEMQSQGISENNTRKTASTNISRRLSADNPPPENRIFGQDIFSRENLTFAPNANMPTPANYVLNAGDEIIIDIWGNSEFNTKQTIAPDGYITLPRIGRLQLSGLSVEQAKDRIRRQLSSVISDLHSGTKIGISIGNIRSIQINMIGEVVVPGTYTLSSFSSAFHALYAAGGTNQLGSLRNISVLRAGKVVASIDVYEYLLKGSNQSDITLRDGDIVMVNPSNVLVHITGAVKRPMRYELLPEETLEDLIGFAGGFDGSAFQDNVSVLTSDKKQQKVSTVNKSQFSRFKLKDGDMVSVGSLLKEFSNKVEISGAVFRQGNYAIGEEIKTVLDLVNVAQGVTGDAFLARALLYRENDDRSISLESFNLAAMMRKEIADIALRKNDRLFIPSVVNLQEDLTVQIEGEVRKPGSYQYASDMALQDLILRAGGLTEAASQARVDVFRRIKDPNRTTANEVSGEFFTFSLLGGLIASKDEKPFILQPFDEVVVRRSPAYEEQQNVTLEGEIVFAGKYAKIRKDERMSSFIQRAGGLTPHANAKGARLLRALTEAEYIRSKDALIAKLRMDKINPDSVNIERLIPRVQYVGINLKKAIDKPCGKGDIILQPGDVLFVPPYVETVKISGGVMYPNTVSYEKGLSLSKYIDRAGGCSRLALKRRAFVIYMNGDVAVGRCAKIEPGCEIVVPERPERTPIPWQNVLGVSTSVASLALIITALFK